MNDNKMSLRQEVYDYVEKRYNCKIEYPWMKYPRYAVFRNNKNKKWYGLIMDISYNKLKIDKHRI